MLDGIIGYERQKERSKKEGKPFHKDGSRGVMDRIKKKVMGKSMWFRNKEDKEGDVKRTGGKRKRKEEGRKEEPA